VPVQAITCVLYCCGALAGSLLFLDGHFTAALLLGIVMIFIMMGLYDAGF